jgi:hypothetical protein
MRRIAVSLFVLAAASLAGYSLANVTHLTASQEQTTDTKAAAAQPTAQPMQEAVQTVYAGATAPETSEAMPEVVYAGQREPAQDGLPVTEYGDASGVHVREIATSSAPEAALPVTTYGGESASAEAGMPETVIASAHMPAAPGMPETVYGASASKPVNEAQQLADEAVAPQAKQAAKASTRKYAPILVNGIPVATASPYSHYTQAERAGMNPCEDHDKGTSPYSNLTDAQRASQTNCW